MSDTVRSRNEWIIGKTRKGIIDNKENLISAEIMKMLNKTIKIFKYKNLPETINPKDLETYLQVEGFAIWKEVDGKMYVFTGGLGGPPNPYYLPTIAVVANPALKYSASLKINEECVVMLNDFYYQGMMPMFNKYATLLIEAEVSLMYAIINARVPAIVTAEDERSYESAKAFFEKIWNAEGYGIVATSDFEDTVASHDFYKQQYITDLIEAIQYVKGSWYNEIGLNAAFNMKREAINEAEATLNEDILIPTLDAMLQCRKEGLEKVNKMFNLNIEVEFDSVWLNNMKAQVYALKALKKEAEGGDSNEVEDKGPVQDEQ